MLTPEVVVDLAQAVVVAAAGDHEVEVGGDGAQLGPVGLRVVLVVDLDPGQPEVLQRGERVGASSTDRLPRPHGCAITATPPAAVTSGIISSSGGRRSG